MCIDFSVERKCRRLRLWRGPRSVSTSFDQLVSCLVSVTSFHWRLPGSSGCIRPLSPVRKWGYALTCEFSFIRLRSLILASFSEFTISHFNLDIMLGMSVLVRLLIGLCAGLISRPSVGVFRRLRSPRKKS